MKEELKIQELERLYRQASRSRLSDFPPPEAEGEKFFSRCRPAVKTNEGSPAEVLNCEVLDIYRDFKDTEHRKWDEIIDQMQVEIAFEQFFLNRERRLAKEEGQANHSVSNAATRYRTDRILNLQEDLEALVSGNLEAWEAFHLRRYQGDIACKNQHRMIDVPYVASAKKRVTQALNNGLPVYIVGHLGGGKTQLAMDAARDYALSKRIQEELETRMSNWYSSCFDATDEEIFEQFRVFWKEIDEEYRENAALLEEIQPLFLSGSHDLTYEDMFVEKTLTLKTSFSENAYLDYFRQIFSCYSQMESLYQDDLTKLPPNSQARLKLLILNSFSDMVIANNSAFGTEVKKLEKEILQAAKEGRPVIIDELNTIAMQNLIGLNDLLQRQAGETAYITGVGPVFIKPGFALIGTGNLSSRQVDYSGTNQLNPAFQSRFITIEYNYLPQSVRGSLAEQEQPEANELFEVVLTHLADQRGFLHLPDMEKSLDELFRLCQLSKLTQNVFIGKWKDNFSPEEEIDTSMGDLELKESVLSIRNIIHVLDSWNLGEEKDLSLALWDGFISSITNSDDQNYILSQAVRYGFFPKQEGWQVADRAVGEASLTYHELRHSPYRYFRAKTESYSDLDIIHLLYGTGPKAQNLPKAICEYLGAEKNLVDIDDYLQFAARIRGMQGQLNLLKQLWEEDRSYSDMEETLSVLTRALAAIKSSGLTDEDFSRLLDETEFALWEQFKASEPYFRERMFPSQLHICPLPRKGARKIGAMVRRILPLGEDCFLVSAINGELRFLSAQNRFAYWSEVLPELSGLLNYFSNADNEQLAVKKNGELLIFQPLLSEARLILREKFQFQSNQLCRTALFNQNTIIALDKNGDLEAFCPAKDSTSRSLGSLPVSGQKVAWMGCAESQLFILDSGGQMLIYNEELSAAETISLGIAGLQGVELPEGDSVFLFSEDCRYQLFSLSSKTVLQEGLLPERPLRVVCNRNFIIIFTYSNKVYLMENHRGKWKLTESATLENTNFSGAGPLGDDFLVFDFHGSPSVLSVERFHCSSI
ncbi:MAG: hypothetical protein GX025_05110 [Clostridiales bacterium]|nr:hypothetical protein [Clostridiales bacterium]